MTKGRASFHQRTLLLNPRRVFSSSLPVVEATLPFVIPSEAEGSAVQRDFLGMFLRGLIDRGNGLGALGNERTYGLSYLGRRSGAA